MEPILKLLFFSIPSFNLEILYYIQNPICEIKHGLREMERGVRSGIDRARLGLDLCQNFAPVPQGGHRTRHLSL